MEVTGAFCFRAGALPTSGAPVRGQDHDDVLAAAESLGYPRVTVTGNAADSKVPEADVTFVRPNVPNVILTALPSPCKKRFT